MSKKTIKPRPHNSPLSRPQSFNMKAREMWPIINSAIRELRLKWEVIFKEKRDANTCYILSDPRSKTHSIHCAEYVLNNPDSAKPDVLHELCHASLGEKRSMILSTHYFAEKYNTLGNQPTADFIENYAKLGDCKDVLDVLVNDERVIHWPDLAEEEVDSLNNRIIHRGRKELMSALQKKGFLDGIALNLAETERYAQSLNPETIETSNRIRKRIFDMLTVELRKRAEDMVSLFAHLPTLPGDKKGVLDLIQQSIIEVAKIKGYTFKPRIIEERGIDVWTFDD